jgi:hypothetical protein
MSLEARSWRPSPLLPPERWAGVAGLFLGVTIITLAAVLAMGWLSADLRARPAIRARLVGGATIAIMAPQAAGDLESLDAATWRAREILAATPGVDSAQVLAPAPADRTIAAAMGTGGAPARLIALALAPRAAAHASPMMAALLGALSREGLAGAGDDHDPVNGPVERALTLDTAGLVLAGLVLLGLVAGLTAARVQARAGDVAPRMSLLSGFGMTDSALLTHLLGPIALTASLGLICGGSGALAILIIAAPWLAGLAPPSPAPGALDLIMAAAWPALAVVISLPVATFVGLGRIRRLAP